MTTTARSPSMESTEASTRSPRRVRGSKPSGLSLESRHGHNSRRSRSQETSYTRQTQSVSRRRSPMASLRMFMSTHQKQQLRHSESTDMHLIGEVTNMSRNSQSFDNVPITAQPVRDGAPTPRRSSASGFFGRLSATHAPPSTIFFDGAEMGKMVVGHRETVENTRARLITEMKGLAGKKFHFWYDDQQCKVVPFEDEVSVKISSCMGHDHILHLRSREFMKNEQNISDFLFSEDRLRDLAPEAETVVRCCFRLLEETMQPKSMKNADPNLPSQALNCVTFIKDVARATVDARRTKENPLPSNVKWGMVQQHVRELEDIFHEFIKREGFALWWFYKADQNAVKQVIGFIQREFRQSPNLRDNHSVFSAHIKSASSQAEALVTTLDKISLEDFLGKKHEKTRIKLASFLNTTEEDLCREIRNKKSNILFSGKKTERSLFRDRGTVPHRNAFMKVLLEKGGLQSILRPLHQFQDIFVDHQAADFQQGTRDWALEAFDDFLTDNGSPHRALIITGNAGSGKTCLVAKLVQTRRERVLGYHFCRHDDYRFREAKSMLLSLAYQLTLQSPHYERRVRRILIAYGLTRKQLLSAQCSLGMIFTELLEKPLAEIPVPASERYVILIDGLDEAKREETGKIEILDAIRDFFLRLPSWILFVFTTRPHLNVLKKLRLFHAAMIEPTSKQDSDDLAVYFTASLHLSNYGSDSDRDILATTLTSQASGNFLYAKILAIKFKEHGVRSDYLSECMMQELDGLLSLEYATVTGFGSKDDNSLFWRIVKLLMVAIKPLHKEVILALTGCEEYELAEFLKAGTTFVIAHDSRVKFIHKTAKDWLLKKLAAFHDGASRFSPTRPTSFNGSSHKDLIGLGHVVSDEVAYCHKFFAERVNAITRDRAGSDRFKFKSHFTRLYVLEHGVHHLALAKRVEEVRGMILDPAWLIARADDPEGIVECCELMGEEEEIVHLVGRAITLATDSVRTDPRQLLSQLVGRLMSSTQEGHGSQEARTKLGKFVDGLKRFDYGFQWWCPVAPTWHQAERPCLRQLIGHTGPVQCVAWHSDGRRCASSSWDASIRVWDSLTGHSEHVYTGHFDTVFSVHWEPSGNRIVSGSLDRLIKVWNTESEECERTLTGHEDSVWCVQWSSDSKRIASGSRDRTVRIWCSDTGDQVSCLRGHDGSVYSVAWEGGINSRVCTGATDNKIRIWSTTTGLCLQTLDGHKDWIRAVHWGQCGKILSASADHTVRVWLFENGLGRCEQVLMGHSDCCWSVSMSSDSRYAVSCSTDCTVKIWNLQNGMCETTFSDHSGPVWSVSWGPSMLVLSGSSDKGVILWDATVGLADKPRGLGHDGPIWSVDVSRDGNTIVTGSSDKTARLWRTDSEECFRVLTGHTGPLYTVRLSNEGNKVATGSSDSTAAIYRISTGERLVLLSGHTYGIWDVVWAPNDRKVFTGSKDNTIRSWCSITGACDRLFEGHTGVVNSLSVSTDCRRLASASSDATLRVWNLMTGHCDAVLQRKDAGALCVEWHLDNIRLSAGYTSGCVRVWNADTGVREIGFLPGHSRRTTTVAWSPDGRKVVSSSTDKEIRIWTKDNHCEIKMKGHTGLGIFSVKWAKNGTIVSSGTDKCIRVWDPETGDCLKVLSGFTGDLGVFAVAWSPDGKKVATGSRDRTVQIFDVQTGKCEAVLTGHTDWVIKIEWEVGGNRVISSSDDGTTRVWELSGKCVLVTDSKSGLRDIAVEKVVVRTQNLSGLTKEYEPVGIQCDKVQAHGDRAVGWAGQKVYFFELIGVAPVIPASVALSSIQGSDDSSVSAHSTSVQSTASFQHSVLSVSNHSHKNGKTIRLKVGPTEIVPRRKTSSDSLDSLNSRGKSRNPFRRTRSRESERLTRSLSHDSMHVRGTVSLALRSNTGGKK